MLQAHTKSVIALQQAAHDFPSVVPLLADKLDAVLPSDLRSHKEFRIETDSLYAFLLDHACLF